MSLVDDAWVREQKGLPSNIPKSGQMDSAIRAASRVLKRWVGTAAYEDAASDTPIDPERKEALKDAETELTMYFLIEDVNLSVSELGIVMSADGNKFGGANFAKASPNQVNMIKQQYFDKAQIAAKEYLAAVTTVKPVQVAGR